MDEASKNWTVYYMGGGGQRVCWPSLKSLGAWPPPLDPLLLRLCQKRKNDKGNDTCMQEKADLLLHDITSHTQYSY